MILNAKCNILSQDLIIFDCLANKVNIFCVFFSLFQWSNEFMIHLEIRYCLFNVIEYQNWNVDFFQLEISIDMLRRYTSWHKNVFPVLNATLKNLNTLLVQSEMLFTLNFKYLPLHLPNECYEHALHMIFFCSISQYIEIK